MHNPYCIKIEPVRGCTRRCYFCSLSTIEWKDEQYQFMPMEMVSSLASDLATWLGKIRIELEGRGEPSLHPQLIELVRVFREKMPRAQITIDTNGDMVKRLGESGFQVFTKELFGAGMNHIVLDCYDDQRFELMQSLFPDSLKYFGDGKIVKKNPWFYLGNKQQQIYLIHSVQENKNVTREITNHAGNLDTTLASRMGYKVAKSAESMQYKMCVQPFRELNIYSDGQIPLCCMDWRVNGRIGAFPLMKTQEAWEQMDRYRANLLHRNRSLQSPCKNCNSRVGGRSFQEYGWFETLPAPEQIPESRDIYFNKSI